MSIINIDNKVGLEELQVEVANLIVETLVLEDVTASEIDFTAPLFGDGLSLDSIDALEIAFAIGETYGFKLRSDDEHNQEIFSCVRSLAKHIAKNRVT
jgi:acyl carrier protein